MPGLLRGVARTAVIAGTATHVSNNVSRRQSQRWAADQPAPAEAAPVAQQAGSSDDMYVELEKLGQLKEQGILTEEEFTAKKQQILGL
jgi:hypothetical protein